MYNEETWQEFAELRKAIKGLAREYREALAEQAQDIEALRAVVSDMIGALAAAGIRAPQAEA
jgi:sarcosine oxidase delta subunit